MGYVKYKDIPNRREPLAGRDHIQHIETNLSPLVPDPGMVAVGSANGVQQLPAALVSLAAQPVVTVRDRFMAADGTALDAHIPEIGQTWTAYTTGKIQVQGGGATGPTTGGMSVAVQPAVGKNVRVRARAVLSTTGGVGVVVRAVDSANFMFAWVDIGAKALRIYGVTEGTTTLLATTPATTLAAGQTILMDVTASGGFVQLTVPGHGSIQWEAVHDGTGVGLRMPAANAAMRVVSFEVEAITDPVVPRLPSLTATNAPSALVLPTMYGDTQGTHPDVIDFGASGWQGYRYWMAWTPHTDGNTANENPSITVSDDGTTWTVPPGLTNPVIPPSGTGGVYNSDPDLTFVDGILYMMYRVSNQAGNPEALYVVQSIDGVNWSAPVEVLRGAGTMIVSPAIVHRDGVYHMWSIASITPRWRTEYRTAPSIYGPWSAPTECVMPMPDPKIDMWHVDVIDHRGRFVAIFSSSDRNQSGSGTNGKLFYAESFDGKQWNMAPTPFLEQGTAGQWDDDKLYRSSAVPTSTGYDLYYSAFGSDGDWRIGRTQVTVTP